MKTVKLPLILVALVLSSLLLSACDSSAFPAAPTPTPRAASDQKLVDVWSSMTVPWPQKQKVAVITGMGDETVAEITVKAPTKGNTGYELSFSRKDGSVITFYDGVLSEGRMSGKWKREETDLKSVTCDVTSFKSATAKITIITHSGVASFEVDPETGGLKGGWTTLDPWEEARQEWAIRLQS